VLDFSSIKIWCHCRGGDDISFFTKWLTISSLFLFAGAGNGENIAAEHK